MEIFKFNILLMIIKLIINLKKQNMKILYTFYSKIF